MTTPASGKAPAKDDEPAYQWTEEMAESVEKLLEHDEANTLCTLDECNTIRKVLLAPESDYWKLEKAKVNPRALSQRDVHDMVFTAVPLLFKGDNKRHRPVVPVIAAPKSAKPAKGKVAEPPSLLLCIPGRAPRDDPPPPGGCVIRVFELDAVKSAAALFALKTVTPKRFEPNTAHPAIAPTLALFNTHVARQELKECPTLMAKKWGTKVLEAARRVKIVFLAGAMDDPGEREQVIVKSICVEGRKVASQLARQVSVDLQQRCSPEDVAAGTPDGAESSDAAVGQKRARSAEASPEQKKKKKKKAGLVADEAEMSDDEDAVPDDTDDEEDDDEEDEDDPFFCGDDEGNSEVEGEDDLDRAEKGGKKKKKKPATHPTQLLFSQQVESEREKTMEVVARRRRQRSSAIDEDDDGGLGAPIPQVGDDAEAALAAVAEGGTSEESGEGGEDDEDDDDEDEGEDEGSSSSHGDATDASSDDDDDAPKRSGRRLTKNGGAVRKADVDEEDEEDEEDGEDGEGGEDGDDGAAAPAERDVGARAVLPADTEKKKMGKAEAQRAGLVEEMAGHLKSLGPCVTASCGARLHVELQKAKMAVEEADAAFAAVGHMDEVRAAMRSRNTLVKTLIAALDYHITTGPPNTRVQAAPWLEARRVDLENSMLKRFVRLSSLVEEVVDVAHRMKLESSTGCIDLTKETAALVPADEAEAEETAEARADA